MAQINSPSLRLKVWREGSIFALIAALFIAANLAYVSSAQESQPAGRQEKAATGGAKHGDQIFQTKCLICHNKQPGDNSPFGPPNLFDAFKSRTITTAQAEDIIDHGKGQMPAFGTILSKGDVESVIAYLKTNK
jgi:mono/diheme cytochrome c family protein